MLISGQGMLRASEASAAMAVVAEEAAATAVRGRERAEAELALLREELPRLQHKLGELMVSLW